MTTYHKSRELIIVGCPGPLSRPGFISIDIQSLHMAHEIWVYTESTQKFHAYKNRNTNHILLIAYLTDKNIKIQCDAVQLKNAAPTQYRFATDKDLFLFNLCFGN